MEILLKMYFLYYSGESDSKEGKCLGVAVSKSPIGPFVDNGEPLLCGSGFINIDPMAFDDPKTGKKLLYWGSGFEGLGDNNPFWNITTGIVLLLSRFIPIIGPLAIAGLLASKKYIPESAGTLKTDTTIFGIMVFAVIAIIAALSFFPALALGPLAEFFTLK